MSDFQWVGAYDNRRSVSSYSAATAHEMIKEANKRLGIAKPKDISRQAAEKLAADHGMILLGSKPWMKLQKIGAKRGEFVNTAPYKLNRFKDVELFFAQLPLQEHQASLAAKSDEEIRVEAAQAKALIF
jgi:hypothetical protein